MSCSAGAGNDDTDDSFVCMGGKIDHALWCAVCRNYGHLHRDTEMLQYLRCIFHDREIGIGAHDDADHWFHALIFKLSFTKFAFSLAFAASLSTMVT